MIGVSMRVTPILFPTSGYFVSDTRDRPRELRNLAEILLAVFLDRVGDSDHRRDRRAIHCARAILTG